MKRYKTVDEYIEHSGKWKDILILLREVICSTDLIEAVKWGGPVYTLNNKNVIGIGGFKNYASIWFFQGSFLKDKQNKLVNAQEGVTRGLRQWRFESIDELRKDLVLLKEYLNEAIQNQIEGKEIKPERKKAVNLPSPLKLVLNDNAALKNCFEKFSPGKQREFSDYINGAKKEETKQKRLEKIIPMILSGEGLNDKYRS